ncbi:MULTISPECIES: zinc-dependent alcohol dehydrogenase family protein [unclassified Herbaspirillum]|uniref:zinc-dependent alcohol dehydrogenase family protein n=1 Tax=unclassified Herbaspirillum TaxID=2624150 RepID=UPI001153A38F|nr:MULTISPECIES: zinc-dependent alcohol dehydrogenase family protein [unclassified Herbaspirillum]MBB5393512.1 alcohol dehydrogenase [Herbaspirillum sp. SJZ102]TQK03740.1 alcohol dehydrogenase [Herbaspirillum sp. SJZ130]TQK08472.1 alcohol dehydrogenase [Herbaspirillum sp. SJZ106]TWC71737.1 alcohol dehydrogenase [Herbaspirillum sp. SJZ099]
MKIQAAVLREMTDVHPFAQSQPLKIEELELDPPGPGEVLVKMKAAGLCHSDLSVITGVRPRPVPMALGHEASAEVVQVGSGVTDLRAGDPVVLVFVPSCGHCMPCMEGRPALCEPGAATNTLGELLSGQRRLHQQGGHVNHHMGVSAFADHAVVSRRSCVKVEADIDPVEAALFGCAVLTGVGAAVNTAEVKAGTSAVVLGLGGVGLCTMLGALASGAREVIAVDLHDSKLEVAKSLGATATVNARDPDAVEKVKALTKGGVDYAFEMAGSVQAMEMAYRMTRRGGMTVTAGLPPPDARWPLQQVSLVAEERTVKGSYIGSCVPLRDIPRYIGLYQAGRLPIDKLMGERMALADINRGFDRLHSGEGLRDLIVF